MHALFFSSRRRHTRFDCDWSSDVCSSDLIPAVSKTKIDGLAAWYGITEPRDISFFSVHMEADVFHSQTARELLETLCDTPEKCEEARAAAATTVNALYRFLDAGN